jgi:hypothetical protein
MIPREDVVMINLRLFPLYLYCSFPSRFLFSNVEAPKLWINNARWFWVLGGGIIAFGWWRMYETNKMMR